jgi:competence protein ComEC
MNRRSDGGHPVAVLVKVAARDGLPHLALPESAALATSLAWLARPKVAVVGLVLTLGLTTAMSGPDGRLHLTVLDIGQGDAILVETPGGGITLIDGGVDPDLTLRRIGSAIPFHRRALTMVVLTHPHQDHLGGLAEVLRRFRVDLFMEGGRPVETAPHRALIAAARAEPGGRVVTAQAGQVIALGGGAELEVVFPSAEDVARPLPDGDVNNGSIVMILRYGEFRALLTGDAESPVEATLAARGELGPIDVLKVGHHGSDSGTTAAFVAALRPRVAIISAGIDNEYGHPHGSTLANLAEVPDIRVYRTDRDGNVEVVTDGRTLQVVTDRLPAAPAGRIGPWPLPTATLPASGLPMVSDDRHHPPRPRRRRVPHRRGGDRVRRPGGRQRSGCPGTRANARRTTHRAGRA